MSTWQRFETIHLLLQNLAKKKQKLAVCIDAQVERLYGSELESLRTRSDDLWFTFPSGEAAKDLSEWERALEYFLKRGISRDTHLVAIGGGALSDVAGFVASTILRGVSWSVVPTTLLSQVDASIGGKVAVNVRLGKNLVGNFHPPTDIYACDEFLNSLRQEECSSGLGEVLKYAFLDQHILQLIESNSERTEIVDACAAYKLKLVAQDLHEKSVRKTLNLGHTFGHGIEWVYKIPHGEAVVWGMGILFALEGRDDLLVQWQKLAQKLKLEGLIAPWLEAGWRRDEIITVVTKDKKNVAGAAVDLVVVDEPGKVRFERRPWDELIQKLDQAKEKILALSLS